MGIRLTRKQVPTNLEITIDMIHTDLVQLQHRINNHEALLENDIVRNDPEAYKAILQRRNKWLNDQRRLLNELVVIDRNSNPS